MAAVPLAFILPALCYLKLDPGRVITWNKLPAFILALFGFCVAIIGTMLAVVRVLDGVKCSHGKEMEYCFNNHGHNDSLLNLMNKTKGNLT